MMSCTFSYFPNTGATVLNYYVKSKLLSLKSWFLCQCSSGSPAKITWKERGLGRQMPAGQQRAFMESEGLRQCMQAAIQTPIYRWNGECDEVCNTAICLDVHPPCHPESHTLWLLFRVLEDTQLTFEKCSVLYGFLFI
ncbi:hypothetical protein GOODEAATRI_000425 [Goodea atripinnis]|uniref:Uncharacterized protein n=1 Tax=Goodea atripinnis TaxID=208336 RepID=A0ABV0PA50_9TELE